VITTADAIKSLRPGAEWVMRANDVENIIWHTEGVEPLTQAEVDAEIARLEQQAVDDAAAREAALESGRAKLLALGLTEGEVAAMTNG
jgi:hypothetical protein